MSFCKATEARNEKETFAQNFAHSVAQNFARLTRICRRKFAVGNVCRNRKSTLSTHAPQLKRQHFQKMHFPYLCDTAHLSHQSVVLAVICLADVAPPWAGACVSSIRKRQVVHKTFVHNYGAPVTGKKKAYTTNTDRKSFGKLFWTQKNTSRPVVDTKTLLKNRESMSTTKIFPLWPPFLLPEKKNYSLEQGGVWFLFPRLTPPPQPQKEKQRSHVLPLEFVLQGPQKEKLRTLSQNCEQTLPKFRTNRITNKWAFLSSISLLAPISCISVCICLPLRLPLRRHSLSISFAQSHCGPHSSLCFLNPFYLFLS